ILLGGPTLARGYRGGDPERVFVRDADGERWWRTADAGSWDGARLRVHGRIDDAVLTGGVSVLPAAVEAALLQVPGIAEAPVVVGTGAAAGLSDQPWSLVVPRAVLALVVALALQVGVNYANDYSDGIRGTDDVRVGPFRLTGSCAAPPGQVRAAAFGAFGVA